MGASAAAAAAAVVLGSAVMTIVQNEAPRIDADLRPSLRSQVDSAALSRDETCTSTETSMDLRADDALLSSGAEAGAVTLASSRDPALAAFGRAALDESGTPSRQLFDAVRVYCYSN